MQKKTSYLLGILLTIVIGTLLYYLCCNCCKAKADAITDTVTTEDQIEVKPATQNAFTIKDTKGDFSFNVNENFNFKGSEFNFLQPISSSLDKGINNLKDYLSNNDLKGITINGLYTSSEKNNSAFPNLGYARANAIKNYFVSKGIPSKQIDIFGKLKDDLVPDQNNMYHGPLSLDISTFEKGDTSFFDNLLTGCNALKEDPLLLYFETGQSGISLTTEQRKKFAKLSRCVDKLDDVFVQIVGHTDNTGDAENNIVLGQKRADFIKSYLISNGISESKINATSRGQEFPIADNATEEGRAKNRRTVVTIN